MQPVRSSTASTSRYARGVSRLDPVKVEAIETALGDDPTLSKSELARRTGLSRATVLYYLRAMPSALQGAHDTAKDRAAESHLDLVAHVADARRAVRAELDRLATLPLHPSTSGVMFRGFGTLERLLRLQAELLGEVSPPTTNVYLSRIELLLASPVSPNALPEELRRALAGAGKT